VAGILLARSISPPQAISTAEWATAATFLIGLVLVVTTISRLCRTPLARCLLSKAKNSPPHWVQKLERLDDEEKAKGLKGITSQQKKENQQLWRIVCGLSTPGWAAVGLLIVLGGFGYATAIGRLEGDFGTVFIAAILGGVISTLLVGEPAALKTRYGQALFDSLRSAAQHVRDDERRRQLNADRDSIVGTDELMVESRDDALVRVLYPRLVVRIINRS